VHASILKIQLFKILPKGGEGMCPLPPAVSGIKMKNINSFIQIAYYTHMGQAITIQKHANT
jgi:hypothetical protein